MKTSIGRSRFWERLRRTSQERRASNDAAPRRAPRRHLLRFVDRLLASAPNGGIGRDLFHDDHYREAIGDALGTADPLVHFLRRGIAAGISPCPLFDSTWYLGRNPDVAGSGLGPVAHFLRYGAGELRAPNAYLDPVWYRRKYPDVAENGMHPLRHYVLYGAAEGRDPGPAFDTNWYNSVYPDVMAAKLNPLEHFLRYGRAEGRQPRPNRLSDADAAESGRWRHAGCGTADIFEAILPDEAFAPPVQDAAGARNLAGDKQAKTSFDVWSTVLHRDCHPDEIKLQSARLLFVLARDRIRPAERSVGALFRARVRAEHGAAPNGDFEYRFDDAIEPWLADVLFEQVPDEQRAQLKRAIQDHEFAAERRSTRIDVHARRTLGELDHKPVFISDFYMPAPFIKALLDEHGIGDRFAEGYASCDMYVNKRSGALFRRVLDQLDLGPADLLHIGDHPDADHAVPQAIGIRTAPHIDPAEARRLIWFGDAFSAHLNDDGRLHEQRMLAEVSLVGGDGETLRGIGARLGIVVFGFCLSIMEDAIRRGVDRVHFLAREGILFRSVYDLVAALEPFNVPAPPSTLLHVSRRATFAASLQEPIATDLGRIWSLYRTQSLDALALSLNVDTEIARRAAARVGLDPACPVADPGTNPAFSRALNDPELAAEIRHRIHQQREELAAYCVQEGTQTGTPLTIVDIGWRGTIQDNLARAFGGEITGHYLALFRYLNPQPDRSTKHGWLGDDNIGGFSLPDQVAPLEMLLNGAGGSTIGYHQTTDGRIEPVREIQAGEEEIVERLAPLREGLLAACERLAHYVRLHGLIANDLIPLSRRIAVNLIERPPQAIADLFGQLTHNEGFGFGNVVEMANLATFREAARAEPGPALHGALTRWSAGSRWPAGAARQGPVLRWWNEIDPAARSSAPLSMQRALSPAIVTALGSRVAVYVPAPLRASGGHRTIFNLVRSLGRLGMQADIYVEEPGEGLDVIEAYLAGTPATLHIGWSGGGTADLAIATIAHSAAHVCAIQASRRAYLVQDREALFNPVGDAYVIAENSYALGLRHLTIGRWLSHVIDGVYGGWASPAGLGADTSVYRPLPETVRERAICMLFQPEKQRRGTALALEALQLVKQRDPDIAIYLFGSDRQPPAALDATHLGLIDDLDALNRLYNRCAAGLCLSLSNPSRIPFELAAAGCVPIDLYRYNNLFDHTADTTVLAYQSPASIAEAILTTVNAVSAGQCGGADLVDRVADRTLQWESDELTAGVLGIMNDKAVSLAPPKATYTAPPVIAAEDEKVGARRFCEWQARLAGIAC